MSNRLLLDKSYDLYLSMTWPPNTDHGVSGHIYEIIDYYLLLKDHLKVGIAICENMTWKQFRAIIVIIIGVGGFASIIYELGNELIQLKNYRSRTMRIKISKLKSHYSICGYGRMGAVIATELHKKQIPFVIVELNDNKIAKMQ